MWPTTFARFYEQTINHIIEGEGIMEDIVCPNCGEELSEERLAKTLICPHCATNLKNKKYMDFLEFLMVSEIVQDIDFFDESVYGDEYQDLKSPDLMIRIYQILRQLRLIGIKTLIILRKNGAKTIPIFPVTSPGSHKPKPGKDL